MELVSIYIYIKEISSLIFFDFKYLLSNYNHNHNHNSSIIDKIQFIKIIEFDIYEYFNVQEFLITILTAM